MKYLSFIALLTSLLLPSFAMADSDKNRPDHYKGKPSHTLTEAVANFRDANQQLAKLLGGELSNSDIAIIHETTYTLENALAKIQAEVTQLAETLEAVHVASEQVNRDTLKTQGAAYLQVTRELEKLGAAHH